MTVAWDLDELAPFDGPARRREIVEAERAIEQAELDPSDEAIERARTLAEDLRYLGWAVLACDGGDAGARWLAAQGEALVARVEAAVARQDSKAEISRAIVAALDEHGPGSWRLLYKKLLGSRRVTLAEREVGASETFKALLGSDRTTREAAWRGRVEAWAHERTTLAAAVSSLTGWRATVAAEAGHATPLDAVAERHRMQRATLDGLVVAVRKSLPMLRRGHRALARVLGYEQFAPWDRLLTVPGGPRGLAIQDALDRIEGAMGRIVPSMGEFVRAAREGRWIDAREGSRRRPGAFCAPLARFRTPRVFTTWGGDLVSMRILCHELGHGHHYWSLRALPHERSRSPLPLEELPSTFCELAAARELAEGAVDGRAHRLQDLMYLCTSVLRLTQAHALECAFQEARREGRLSPERLDEITMRVADEWTGDAVRPNILPGSWATLRHLYLEPFASIPYVVSICLALGLMAVRRGDPSGFAARYQALLESLGASTVEEIVRVYFDSTPDALWTAALAEIGHAVDELEKVR